MNAVKHLLAESVPREENGDWTRPYVKYRMEVAGWTFGRIAREFGVKRRSPAIVFRRRWRRVEEKVAKIVGAPVWDVWPSRYPDLAKANGLDPESIVNRGEARNV